jgi:2-oxo-4-hydroxy-4-carboxy-5-ureidoimidazoline decarboxylase
LPAEARSAEVRQGGGAGQAGGAGGAGREDTKKWSQQEQAGAADAAEDTLRRLAEGNRDYQARFGYIFIVCATGRTAGEMLALLEQRLRHDAGEELPIAAEEQRQITQLRLRKLLEQEPDTRS